MSTEEDRDLGTVKLQVEEGRKGLWDKTKQGFKYVFDNHFEEFEWFLKADDDTFVIVENLKYLLSNYSTNDPIHFGHHYKYMGVSRGLNIDRSFNQYPRSEKTILMLSGSVEANFSLLF